MGRGMCSPSGSRDILGQGAPHLPQVRRRERLESGESHQHKAPWHGFHRDAVALTQEILFVWFGREKRFPCAVY